MFLGSILYLTLLVTISVKASTIEEAKSLKVAFCENDTIGDKIENCFEKIQKTEIPEEFDKIAKACCPGVGDRKTGKEVREWYCSTTVETIQKCNECQEEKLKNVENQEEIKKVMAPFEDCILHVFSNSTDEV
ncbi:unnamed protein product [Larinioides sclopetarius]|uniref:Uncharacterized protein n=1 Tax=Larinioides sclopetarius TaxID=280406 RepID=A0AAV2AX09_9ARAC